MTKEAFLAELQNGLAGLPQEEITERLSFYAEMIADRMEEGISEEEAVAGIGPVSEIIPQILSEIPLTKLVKEKIKPGRSLRAWEIILLVLGFPLWFPLLLAAAVIILVLYVSLWVLLLSLWAVAVSFLGTAVGCAAAAVLFAVRGDLLPALAMLGAALFVSGLTIFLIFGCVAASKGLLRLSKSTALAIKKRFMRKENAV